ILPDRVAVQDPANEREIVEVEAAGEKARPHRHERSIGERAGATVDGAGKRRRRLEVVELIRVPRAGDVHDAPGRIDDETGRVRESDVGDRRPPLPGAAPERTLA